MSMSRAEIIADLTHHHRHQGRSTPTHKRQEILSELAAESLILRDWHRQVRRFGWLYPVGLTAQLTSLALTAVNLAPLLGITLRG